MCRLFDDWANDIRSYCKQNDYDFEKVKKLSQCWGKGFLALQYHDESKGKKGLLDETPMPLVLLIRSTASGLIFEETENTEKYLKRIS